MFARQEKSPARESLILPLSFGGLRIPAILGLVSEARRLEKSARLINLPETMQQAESGGYNFYGDLYTYANDIAAVGISRARTLLYERLFTHLLTMDQEARRRALTYPIPIYFENTRGHDHPSGRVAGYGKEWRQFLTESLATKPEGPEKDRFRDEINLTMTAFDELLQPIRELLTVDPEQLSEEKKIDLLTNTFGYRRATVEVTPFLVSLFPDLEGQLGKMITSYQSETRVYAYTPSPYHLGGQSSFLYAHQIAYLPEKGFVGLQQGLMSGYMEEDLAYILASLTERDPTDLDDHTIMQSVFSPIGKYSHMNPDELFAEIKKIVPFKSLAIEQGVNPKACSQDEYGNYINTLEAVFEKEIALCAQDPEYITGLQERIERFSIYLAVAMGMTEKLPTRKMLRKYSTIFAEKKIAQDPSAYTAQIDTSFAFAYRTLFAVPFKLEALLECSAIGALQAGIGKVGGSIATPSLLLAGIQENRSSNFSSIGEAREFAARYGINPNWIGDVIKYYPGGKECLGYGNQGKHTAHWVGQCGKNSMCLACNAQYNFDHGLVPGVGQGESEDIAGAESVNLGEEKTSTDSTMNLSLFVAGIGNPELWKGFSESPPIPLAA